MKRSILQYRRVATLIRKQVVMSGKPFVEKQVEDNKVEILFIGTYTGYRFLKYDKVKGIIVDTPNPEEMKVIEALRSELG